MRVLISLCMMAIMSVQLTFAQTGTVKGKITSTEDGLPLPGATVTVKGTTVGEITDTNGNFTLNLPPNASVLVFSYVGMKSQEILIGSQTQFDIALSPDVKSIQEVVVTGIGTATDRRRVAISVETVKSKDLSLLPSASIDQSLQGKIAGAQIQSISGQPGQQSNIILRGINTLDSNQPMILVDGIEINTDNNYNGSNANFSSRLSDLDLSNIERIEVVQGAASATIYGAQGANGVIQIFTKKGTAGITTVNLTTSASINEVLRGKFSAPSMHYYDTDAQGYIIDSNGNRVIDNQHNSYNKPTSDVNDPATLANKPFKEQTYSPLDQVFKKAYTYSHGVSVSGGNANNTYALYLSDLRQQSVIHGNFERINAKLNIGSELFKNFKVNATSTFINTTNSTGGITGQDDTRSPLGSAMLSRPYMDMNTRDNNGNLLGRLEQGENNTNPLFGLENQLYHADINRFIQNMNLNYKPFKFFEIDYKFGLDNYSYKFQDLVKNQESYEVYGIDPVQGRIRTLNDKGSQLNSIITGFLNLSAKDFSFKTQVAFDWRKKTYDEVEARVDNIPASDDINLSRGATPYITELAWDFVTFGYLINQKIEYKDIAGISGGFRTDWSSAFGEASKPFTFPRGDVYFRPSQLSFWSGLKPFFPELKLRIAYGEAGVQPAAFDRIITLLSNTIGNQAFLLSKVQQTNPALNVQISKEFEAGVDITLGSQNSTWFGNVTLSPTLWKRKSEDVIRLIDVPLSTGASSYLDNAFTLSSHGLQTSINVGIFNAEKFSWDFTSTYGKSITTVDKISNHRDIIIGQTGSGGFVLREGASLGSFFGLSPLSSITQTRSDGSRYIDDANTGNYEIVNGFVVNKATKQVQFTTEKNVIGDPTPDFILSFINRFRIGKAISITCQVDWYKGMDIYNQSKQWLYRDANHSDFTKSVTVNGQTGPYTAYWNSLYNANEPSSPFVEDGSFVRLRELSAAVDIAKLMKIKFTKSLVVNISGHNLWTHTKYSGLDPEAAANLNDPERRGLDNYSFPNFKTFTLGLSIGF